MLVPLHDEPLLTWFSDHPRPRAQRTLTLITKTLQTLANMTTFGAKEPWMEPMNVFLTSHRQQFKAFVDQICDISSDRATSAIPPSYATPITILNRLPSTSREGFPSLPYLIDQARECASLVDVWLDAKQDIDDGADWGEELRHFDKLCRESRGKARQCLTRAEQAERPSGCLEPKWEELVEQMQRKARAKEPNGQSSPSTPATDGHSNLNSSTSSLAESYLHRNSGRRHMSKTHRSSPGTSHLATATSPQSPLSPDEGFSEEPDSESSNTPPGSSSGWDLTQSPPDDQMSSRLSDAEGPDTGIENSSDVVGSSIYSLTPVKSNRDSAATAKAVPASSPRKTSSGSRKGPHSVYSLRHTSDRGDGSKSADRTSIGSKPGSRDGPPSQQPIRSLYRLHGGEGSPAPADSSASLGRKSPSSREGKAGLREGVFGGVFRKKTRDRESDDGWRSGGLSS